MNLFSAYMPAAMVGMKQSAAWLEAAENTSANFALQTDEPVKGKETGCLAGCAPVVFITAQNSEMVNIDGMKIIPQNFKKRRSRKWDKNYKSAVLNTSC